MIRTDSAYLGATDGWRVRSRHHQVLDGAPVFTPTRTDSAKIDGVYCRVHAQLRTRQLAKEQRQQRSAAGGEG